MVWRVNGKVEERLVGRGDWGMMWAGRRMDLGEGENVTLRSDRE